MNPWKVQIIKSKNAGYVVYVWETGLEPGKVHRLENEEKLKQFLDGLWASLAAK